jgi:alkanesulfonate monooxygenase
VSGLAIDVFITLPSSSEGSLDVRAEQLTEVARWSERVGCRGVVLDGLIDPWLAAQAILESTETLRPLVTIRPADAHPYAAAKMVASLGYLYGRQVGIHFVGDFGSDAHGATAASENGRHRELGEYAVIVKALLTQPGPLTFEGEYYTVRNLKMTPRLAPELSPMLMVSGITDAAQRTAGAIGATVLADARSFAADRVSFDAEGPSGVGIVGSSGSIADLEHLVRAGVSTAVLDGPASREERDDLARIVARLSRSDA